MKNKKAPMTTKTVKKAKRKSRILPFLSKIMPYILAVLFVITLFSLVGLSSGFGGKFAEFLRGSLSAFASWFVPVFMLYHSLMWYHDTRRKICARRVTCSFIIIFLVSALQEVIQGAKDKTLITYNIVALFENGKAGNGGGVVGGIIGTILYGFGKGVAMAVILILLLFMFLQMFNITPSSMMRALFGKGKDKEKEAKSAKKPARRALSAKHRKFDVFDDEEEDDDFSESNVSNLEMTDSTSFTKAEDTVSDTTLNVQRNKVRPFARPAPSHNQIKPFDRSRVYKPAEILTEPEEEAVKPEKVEPAERAERAEGYTSAESFENTESFGGYGTSENDLDKSTEFVLSSSYSHKSGSSSFAQKPATENSDFYDDKNDVRNNENYSDISYKNEDTEYRDKDYNEYGEEAESTKEDDFSDYISKEALEKISSKKEEELPLEKKSFFGIPKRSEAPAASKYEPPVQKTEKPKVQKRYVFPPIDFLKKGKVDEDSDAIREELQENARIIVETLNNFNTRTKIVDITRGPTVTRYELMPEAGVRVRSIANLVDDIALNLAAEGIRIECPIPGKSAVGIEVPNRITSLVYLRDLLEDNKFKIAKSKLTCALGKSISGENIFIDIEKLPHLLVAGATGMGKSVCINSLLVSLLYKATPEDVRLILIDPKRVELSNYNGIPHLLVPVVCEPKKSLGTLQWAVSEMERRFAVIEEAGVRNIIEYNDKVDSGMNAEKMPRIVIVIDELADLKMAVPEIEDHIMRLTQKARAAGIHIIIGTQRPSVDVITGVIKANIPSRIAFRVPSQVDSRTILDEIGAEKLVSRGDMLVKPVGALKPIRVQGAFITADEIESIIDFLKENATENYDEEVMQQIDSNASKLAKAEKKADGDMSDEGDDDELDPKFYAALELATDMGKISSSFLQRKLGLGFQRAARIIDQMEMAGYIGEANGSKPRDVLITKEDFLELRMRNSDPEE